MQTLESKGLLDRCGFSKQSFHRQVKLIIKCGTLQERTTRVRKQYTDKVRKSKQTDLKCNKSVPARVNYRINNNYCCYAYVKISSRMNNGYLYVNYSRTNNCYSYVKLMSKQCIKILLLRMLRVFAYGRIYTTEYI